jgi:putative PIN family toxin of toxin-antitoxin system
MASRGDGDPAAPGHLLRVFVDSSVLIAAALSMTGAGFGLIELARQGMVLLFSSTYALGEVERNPNRKAPHGLGTFREQRTLLQIVEPLPELVTDVERQIEPKDAAIVAGAIAAQADYLVSYDRHHLLSQVDAIRGLYKLETVEPRDLLNILRRRR